MTDTICPTNIEVGHNSHDGSSMRARKRVHYEIMYTEFIKELHKNSIHLSPINEHDPNFYIDNEIIIAYCGHEPVGFVRFYCFDAEISTINIKNLYVRESYRNLGYAKWLIDAVECIGRYSGCKRVTLGSYLSNTSALALYKSVGFTEHYVSMHKKLE